MRGIFAELVDALAYDRQLPQYAAVAAGIRRAVDDWVPTDRFVRFRALMMRLGIVVEVDCLFEPSAADAPVIGSEFAPTTWAAARPFCENDRLTPGSRVHVVVSSRAEWAADALAAAWYPVSINGRVLRKPLIDHVRLGKAFGYPDCCVDFFLRHNDWARQNTIAEAVRRSGSFRWETNCLTKHTPWMLSYHMPCSFDCAESIRYGRGVMEAVRAWDAEYADAIAAFMRRPCLMLSERFACALDGGRAIGDHRYAYDRIDDLNAEVAKRGPDHRRREVLLAAGDNVEIADATLLVRRGDEVVGVIETRADRDVVEVPLFLPFA
jgi:hypothetical protein